MLAERWKTIRNRLLAGPRFQAWAARLPFTRPVAHRHARRLFDLVAGFTYSQTLFACAEIGLFDRLARGPATVDEIAALGDLPASAAARLVGAAAALELVDVLRDGRVMPGVAAAALLGDPGIAAMIAHHPRLYADLADPVALLRKGGGDGELASFWRYARDARPEAVGGYSALMAASQPAVARVVLDAYRVARHRRLLDVGGGEGAFLEAVGARAPGVARGLFDLPAVGERARNRLGAAVAIHGGDFLADPLPEGYDLITLIRVLHDHDDAPALALLRAVRAALPRGGRLLIGEPMAGMRGMEPVGATYFAFYLLAMGQGRARTAREIGAMLRDAGFRRSSPLKTAMPLTASVIVAEV